MCHQFLPLFFLLSYSTGYVLDSPQIHKTFGQAELRKVFQVAAHENVPEYQLVSIRSISKREASNKEEMKKIYLSAFGRNYHLNLQRNEPFQEKLQKFKVFLAETTNSGLEYREMPPQNDTSVGTPYHDDKNMAAVMIDEDNDGNFRVDGTIANDLIVKPVPEVPDTDETDDDYIDDELFLEEDEPSNSKNSTTTPVPKKKKSGKSRSIPKLPAGTHIVYKRKLASPEVHSDFFSMEAGYGSITENRTTHKRTRRDAPDTVWPEVLLIVDYDTFVLHGGNSHDIKRYFVSFWNGVDLRYKQLSHPTIRVSLAGMIVAKDRDATPYLEQNRLRSPNADAVDAAGALTDLGKYLYREDRLPTYDLAVVITKLDMCRRRFQGGRCNRGTAGFAYVGGACVVNKRLEKVNSVAIIEDSGGFSGIIVAAHEVGHLLGCVHDGSPPPSYLGGPGATRCPWEDGFIMSDLRHTERGFRWSSCSIEQFKHFLNGETATCLYNFPHENDLLPRVLPGTTMTLDQQCKRDRGTTACFRDGRVCAQLFCFDSSSGYCVSYRPAAEGSPCGDGQVCRNGRCLAEIENIIPDYTHVTQTFANRPQTDIFARRSGGNTASTTTRQPRSRRPNNFSRKVADSSTSPPVKNSHRRCQDSVQKVGGSLSCKEFLERFGNRYCRNDYMKKNCCASHTQMCQKG